MHAASCKIWTQPDEFIFYEGYRYANHVRGTMVVVILLFSAQSTTNNIILEAKKELSLLITKTGKNHTIKYDLIKSMILVFLETDLEKNDKEDNGMPLGNKTVCKRTDGMNWIVEE